MYYPTIPRQCQPPPNIFFSHHTPIKPTPSPHQPLLTTKNILTTITLLPYNTPILPLRVHDHAPRQATPRTASRLLLQKARVHRTWSERASAACSRLRFGSCKGGPFGRRSRSHNARANGALWLTRRRRHGKQSSVAWCGWLRQACVKSSVACAWLASCLCGVGVMRRVVPVRWRACVGAVCAPLRHALAVCMCVRTHAPQTSCA